VANKPLVVGNWKMNTTREDASALARAIVGEVRDVADKVNVVVLPPFPWLTDIASILDSTGVALGAQTMHPEASGAYTGEVSPRMLKGLCQYVLVGQYERRILYAEKDALIRRKLQAAAANGIAAILCIGEDADQLDEGLGLVVVAEQLEAALGEAGPTGDVVLAYEPSWTTIGRVAPPPVSYVAEIIGHIRQTLADLYSATVSEQTRVIYGGQVNPRNIAEIAAVESIDGVLAGTASTNAANFANIVRAFATR
jgi:triosephosphate isomerase